ncbi:MAG: hypothetical protein OEZ06_18510 [Myxococcales bacterium]|nr:hypothetical protein [Myxococcales bacterium]
MGIFRAVKALLLLASALVCACAAEGETELVLRGPEELRRGEEQFERLCNRPIRDPVTDVFCVGTPPPVRSLMELRNHLGLTSEEGGEFFGHTITGHSTSLVHRSVSAINPRVIFVRPETEGQEFMAMGFARGEQFTEIAVKNRVDGEFQFYLVMFSLPCDEDDGGCTPGALLTEAIESGWTGVNVYGEQDLQNTPLDCRVCHQPAGTDTRKLLRMQELEPPWNHWFYLQSKGGRALMDDYYAAKGDEPFAGISGADIAQSQPGLLSSAIFFAGSPPQPNAFVSNRIEPEVVASARALGGDQPADNSVPGSSETWEAIYERAKRGEAISVPYHDVKVTDPQKLEVMTTAYVDYREGRMEREALPDIREVFPDDERLLARMGMTTEPGLSGEEVLLQACSLCHNERLDRTITRSRFDVNLSLIGREEKERAIARIQLPIDDPRVMPPRLVRRLSEEGRERLIELLSK